MKRLVIVTGAAGGIGYAAVKLFVEKGWEAIGIDLKDPVAPIDGASFEKLDLADPSAIEAFADRIKAKYSRLDALVNNAAMQICKPLVDITADDFDTTMATNLRAVFLLTGQLYPLLREARGAVINTAS
ncbi:MAG: SDR family oxidoreductase, partial [Anaerolineales bacterium]|nr:SDR family oxidoreductase [Anaerolineales bacterium]